MSTHPPPHRGRVCQLVRLVAYGQVFLPNSRRVKKSLTQKRRQQGHQAKFSIWSLCGAALDIIDGKKAQFKFSVNMSGRFLPGLPVHDFFGFCWFNL